MKDRHFTHFNMAGFTYYDGIEVFQELKVGTTLTLAAEPDNQHDPYAVALFYNNKKLGYIPREENQQISQFLNLGYTNLFEVRINRIAPESYPEKQIGVVVRVRENNSLPAE